MPADVAGMSGYVMNGRVHAHITLATPDKAFGGHLESGNPVLTFAIVTIGVLPVLAGPDQTGRHQLPLTRGIRGQGLGKPARRRPRRSKGLVSI